MPLYVWECLRCGKTREVVSPIADRNAPQTCCEAMVRVITAPHAMPDIGSYIALSGDRAGKPISGRAEHREFLKRNRLVEVGTEPVRDTRKPRKIHRRGELVPAIKDAIAQVCTADVERGGLIERRR